MSQSEDALTRAERHVREGEACVAHLIAIIGELDRDRHLEAAERARRVLVTLRESLGLARTCLRMECEACGIGS
jgi:hypothetical protein